MRRKGGYRRNFTRIIGLQLRLIRYEQNKTLEQVASDNEILPETLENLEMGLLPSWRNYEKLLDYYGCELKIVPIEE